MNISSTTQAFIEEHLNDDLTKLRLRRDSFPEVDFEFAINQINGQKKATGKLPTWASTAGILYPAPLSLEQCSSELTARFKASLVKGKTLIDLTGGFGVDSYFLSANFEQLIFVEQNQDLLDIAQHNFQLLDFRCIWYINQEGISFLHRFPKKADWMYIDPARRHDKKGKVFLLEDCEPDVLSNQGLFLEKAENVLIKLSPMFDLTALERSLEKLVHIYVVAVKNEVKELLVHVSNEKAGDGKPGRTAVNIHSENEREIFRSEEKAAVNFSPPLAFVYEPNKAILKADLQDALGHNFSLSKLARQSHFYSSDKLHKDFPGRVYQVKKIIKAREKNIRAILPDRKANVIARNFPLSAPQLYQKFKIQPGGKEYLLATTLQSGERVLIWCDRVN